MRSTYSAPGPPHPRACMHPPKARLWSVRLRLPDYGMGDVPVEQRSPSPEPIFDKNGQRVNSRVVLRRQKLDRERAALVESLKPKVALRSAPSIHARVHGAWGRSTPPPPPATLQPGAATVLAQAHRAHRKVPGLQLLRRHHRAARQRAEAHGARVGLQGGDPRQGCYQGRVCAA
jgi:hypothetical protein